MTPMLAQRRRADRAFERIYRNHVREVYSYALAVLPTAQDAEDVTQTTFLNAYRAFASGERSSSDRNWLIGLVHQLCEQRARRHGQFQEVELEDQAELAVPDEEGPSANDIRRALGRLAFDQRSALIMREVEGRTYEEIAELLEVSQHEVESLLFRARRTLREELEGALTCHEAERAISRRLDDQLARSERRFLRRHLRECDDCARFARSQEKQRDALRALAKVALPSSLATFVPARA